MVVKVVYIGHLQTNNTLTNITNEFFLRRNHQGAKASSATVACVFLSCFGDEKIGRFSIYILIFHRIKCNLFLSKVER
jgi:hypothetical protein